jgi:HK97 family phage major capsid protein
MATQVSQAATLSELDAQIKDLFEQADAIERRYPDGEIKDTEDLAQVKALLSTIDEKEDQRTRLEDAEQRKSRVRAGLDKYARPAERVVHAQEGEVKDWQILSPGEQFVRDSQYRHFLREGAFKSDLGRAIFAVQLKDGTSLVEWKGLHTMQQKALLRGSDVSGGGPFVYDDILRGLRVDIRQRELNLLDLIPRLQTASDTIQYIREDTFTNNAAMVAEASATTGTSGLKPESAFAYSTQTAPVRTAAHWVPITNRLLDDAPAMRGIIDSRLLLGLNLTLETQIISGGGTGEDFLGILGSGILTQAIGTDSVLDAIFKARTQIRVTGHARPTAVVLHPNDWQGIRLARENSATGTLGGYLMGPPSDLGATTVWGMPVVEAEGLTENTGLVGAFDIGASLFDREQAAIRVGTINDQFVRNMQTILAEMRAAFVVWRPSAFCRVTGI